MNNITEGIHINYLLIVGVIIFVINTYLSFYWGHFCAKFRLNNKYNNIQKNHNGEISRLGGFLIYTALVTYLCLDEIYKDLFLLKNILISFVPVGIVAIKEDLFLSNKINLRLIMMFVSSFLLLFISDYTLPIIDIYYIGDFINEFTYVKYLFFGFCIVIIINGSNLIDGTNGLLSIVFITQLVSLTFLAFSLNEKYIIESIFLLYFFLLIFMIFNYPFGRIFLGDFGSYFFGFIISALTIYLFGKYTFLNEWNAVLILIYPSFELLFSFIRKIFMHQSPLLPDRKHLHLLVYDYLKSNNNSTLKANSYVVVLLFPLILLPQIIFISNNFYYHFDTFLFFIISISVFCFIYIFVYLFFSQRVNKWL